MAPQEPSISKLAFAFLLSAGYLAAITQLDAITGDRMWDGVLGVVVGLFVCAQPAANGIHLIYHRGLARRQFNTARGKSWLALNIVVLIAGTCAVSAGVTTVVRERWAGARIIEVGTPNE